MADILRYLDEVIIDDICRGQLKVTLCYLKDEKKHSCERTVFYGRFLGYIDCLLTNDFITVDDYNNLFKLVNDIYV